MRKVFLVLCLCVLPLLPSNAQVHDDSPKFDLAERIGRTIRLSSDQEDRLASLHSTLLLKTEDITDSFGPVAEKRLGTLLKTKYANELAAIDAAPEDKRDERSRTLVRKVSAELRLNLEKELRSKLRAVVTEFFNVVAKLLKPSQRPKLKTFQLRYLAQWDREKPAEIRRDLNLILGATPTKRL